MRERIEKLKDILFISEQHDSLKNLPEQLAAVLEAYDETSIHPAFRAEVFQLLSGCVAVSRAMLDPSIPVKPAVHESLSLIKALARVIGFLEDRPTNLGYAVFSAQAQELLPEFHPTKDSAERAVRTLRSVGATEGCRVVEASLVAGHVGRPSLPPQPTPTQTVESVEQAIREAAFPRILADPIDITPEKPSE